MSRGGIMAPRCKQCDDGRITLYGGGRRMVTTCTCARGRERQAANDNADLRARLLAAFYEVGRERE